MVPHKLHVKDMGHNVYIVLVLSSRTKTGGAEFVGEFSG